MLVRIQWGNVQYVRVSINCSNNNCIFRNVSLSQTPKEGPRLQKKGTEPLSTPPWSTSRLDPWPQLPPLCWTSPERANRKLCLLCQAASLRREVRTNKFSCLSSGKQAVSYLWFQAACLLGKHLLSWPQCLTPWHPGLRWRCPGVDSSGRFQKLEEAGHGFWSLQRRSNSCEIFRKMAQNDFRTRV